ncbi:hypothetical protein SLE2022_345770 [Rubroshorea leprosula]
MVTPNQSKPKVPNNKTKTTKGRQKVEIKKVEKKSNLQVTFSKRRQGLFKKASELCVLCGAKVGIIVFSPKDKPFCFGHPDIETVVDQYLMEHENPSFDLYGDVYRCQELLQLNKEYEALVMELEREKMIAKAIEEGKIRFDEFWWDRDINSMGMEELEEYVNTMEEMKNKLDVGANDLMTKEVAASTSTAAEAAAAETVEVGDSDFTIDATDLGL